MNDFYVLICGGHGSSTAGKCSPIINFEIPTGYPMNTSNEVKTGTSIIGSRFREWRFNRRLVNIAGSLLKENGFNVINIVPEDTDIPLSTRVKRINKYCEKYGAGNCILVSIHVNAAGNGGWYNARGWSIWTTRKQNNSDKLATEIWNVANEVFNADEELVKSFNKPEYKKYKPVLSQYAGDSDPDYEADFYIIKGANCPAVLIENGFQDNKDDVKYLESAQGFCNCAKVIAEGVESYYNKYKKK